MKHLTAHQLLTFLLQEKANGTDLTKVKVNYRPDRDSDVAPIKAVEPDLYKEDNTTLESIVFLTDAREI